MKASERHHLKTNEVAEQIARLTQKLGEHSRQVAAAAAAVAMLAVAAGAYWAYRTRTLHEAGAALAGAMAILDAPVVPPPPPGSTGPGAPAGSYPSEQARAEAALAAFRAAAERYAGTAPGVAARYHAAALLLQLGRPAEAEPLFKDVADRGGVPVYARMARLGLAEAQVAAGRYDEAIATYRDLAAQRDGDLPVDGLLMQLGRAYALAGKAAEAQQTYQRIVDEFPESLYAPEARRQVDALKAGRRT
jgi:TolA-binding protein